MCAHGSHLRCIQIELGHRFQRNLVQQQPLRVLNGHMPPQLRQHIAAKGRGVLAGEKQPLPAQGLQRRGHPGRGGTVQPPKRVLAEQIVEIQAAHPAQRRFHGDLHTAPPPFHLQRQGRNIFF